MSDLCAHQLMMMNDGFIVCHLAATLLSAMWHLECMSKKGWDGGNLLCMVMMLGVITIK